MWMLKLAKFKQAIKQNIFQSVKLSLLPGVLSGDLWGSVCLLFMVSRLLLMVEDAAPPPLWKSRAF